MNRKSTAGCSTIQKSSIRSLPKIKYRSHKVMGPQVSFRLGDPASCHASPVSRAQHRTAGPQLLIGMRARSVTWLRWLSWQPPPANNKLFFSRVVHFSGVIAFFSYFCRRPPFLKCTTPKGTLPLGGGNSKPSLRALDGEILVRSWVRRPTATAAGLQGRQSG